MRKFNKTAILLYNYGSVISIIIFVLGSILLAKTIPGFSFFHYTISQLYIFAGIRGQQVLFYLFLSKFLLDVLFSLSVFRKVPVKILSPAAILWFMPVISFGALGFFPTGGQYVYPHFLLSLAMVFSWIFSEYVFAGLSKNLYFIAFTRKFILLQLLIMAMFSFSGHINGVFEIIYLATSLLWIWTFLLVLELR